MRGNAISFPISQKLDVLNICNSVMICDDFQYFRQCNCMDTLKSNPLGNVKRKQCLLLTLLSLWHKISIQEFLIYDYVNCHGKSCNKSLFLFSLVKDKVFFLCWQIIIVSQLCKGDYDFVLLIHCKLCIMGVHAHCTFWSIESGWRIWKRHKSLELHFYRSCWKTDETKIELGKFVPFSWMESCDIRMFSGN